MEKNLLSLEGVDESEIQCMRTAKSFLSDNRSNFLFFFKNMILKNLPKELFFFQITSVEATIQTPCEPMFLIVVIMKIKL